MVPERLTLMAIHAHPDDEIFGTGGVFARAADEGMRTVLVVATGGEEGEIRDPARDTPDERARLAAIRAEELRRSTEILGIEEVHFLGYRDSGMLGTPANDNPDNFLQTDRGEAVRRVVRLIREVRPDVLVTYDERGGYGHPDHVTAHEVTTAAVEAAGDPDRYPTRPTRDRSGTGSGSRCVSAASLRNPRSRTTTTSPISVPMRSSPRVST